MQHQRQPHLAHALCMCAQHDHTKHLQHAACADAAVALDLGVSQAKPTSADINIPLALHITPTKHPPSATAHQLCHQHTIDGTPSRCAQSACRHSCARNGQNQVSHQPPVSEAFCCSCICACSGAAAGSQKQHPPGIVTVQSNITHTKPKKLPIVGCVVRTRTTRTMHSQRAGVQSCSSLLS